LRESFKHKACSPGRVAPSHTPEADENRRWSGL
jgi:hypothetical protein